MAERAEMALDQAIEREKEKTPTLPPDVVEDDFLPQDVTRHAEQALP
jgi:hypothetical protein